MKKMKWVMVILILLLAGPAVFAQTKGDAILGIWLSEKKDTRFEIFRQNDRYFGKIQWGTGSATKDIKNPDSKLRSRDVVGLVIINNLQFDGNKEWGDGTIYDPREGKTYSCKVILRSPDQLSVRGYMGISLFGRSETWTKVK